MTHLHCYDAQDLRAYLSLLDLDVRGYRVVFNQPTKNPFKTLRFAASTFVISRILGADYADNILLIAQRKAEAG